MLTIRRKHLESSANMANIEFFALSGISLKKVRITGDPEWIPVAHQMSLGPSQMYIHLIQHVGFECFRSSLCLFLSRILLTSVIYMIFKERTVSEYTLLIYHHLQSEYPHSGKADLLIEMRIRYNYIRVCRALEV